MTDLHSLTASLSQGRNLTPEQAASAARALALPEVNDGDKSAFLLALAEKGESAEEVAAFAQVFRELARDPGLEDFAKDGIDIVGTGGDKSGSFNFSTAAAFFAAARGVPVLKHGNRSITSHCGSADLLEDLGFVLQAEPEDLRRSLEATDFCFFFAPAWHPAFKAIMPVRKALAAGGRRTVFNILGPLINPGKPARQLFGVFAERWLEPYARCGNALGLKRGLVVHGRLDQGGMDELICAGGNRVMGIGELDGVDEMWRPEQFGLARCAPADLAGGSAAENVKLLEEILSGRGRPGLRDTLLLNAGAALWVAEKAEDMAGGIVLARELLAGGAVRSWLEKARSFYRQGDS